MPSSEYTFRYRVRNWSEYNRALVTRGRLTFWFDEDAIASWRNRERSAGPGTPRIYSDTAIECALVLQSVFHLSLRATQGFVASLMQLLELDLPVPDYSTISRRQGALTTSLAPVNGKRPRHIVVDATGVKVYGAGEWYLRKHRRSRQRTWRKLHLGVDETTKEIVAVEVTASHVHNSRMLPPLLDQVPGQLGQLFGDRAYDTRLCYESTLKRGARVTIVPRRNARQRNSLEDWRIERNAVLKEIEKLGRYEWRVSSRCTRQSLAENAISRFKALFGPRLSTRRLDNQRAEAMIKCTVLNRMTSRGMPESVRIQ